MALRVILAAALLAVAAALAPLHGKPIPGSRYIVVFHTNSTEPARAKHLETVRARGSQLIKDWAIGTFFYGYAAVIENPEEVLRVRADEDLVQYVEFDSVMQANQEACDRQKNAIWGLDRVSERKLFLAGNYDYNDQAGEGVDVYVVDTGVYVEHNEFEGRAIWGENFVDSINSDCNGHGTHVAGTTSGKTYGIAKKSTVIGVKVLDCNGSGYTTGIISGIEWMVNNSTARGKRAVGNMSLGGGKSTALNDVSNAAVSAGVAFAVAAGNENQDACNVSPASATKVLSVGATDTASNSGKQEDVRSSFSNYGSCVDIMAPGTGIESAWIGNPSAVLTISGTSMASPHVAGALTLFLGANPAASAAFAQETLVEKSTANCVDMSCSNSACRNTPNAMLYSKFVCDDGPAESC